MSKRKAAESIENSITKIIKRDNIGKAHQYLNGAIPLPYDELSKALKKNSNSKKQTSNDGDHVLHWFRSDFRISDNRSLHRASEWAQSLGKPLITLYIISPREYESHHLSNVKIDLMIRTLLQLQKKLEKLNIPLIIESINNRNFQTTLDKVCDKYKVNHIFANYEYELDELQRDCKIVKNLAPGRVLNLVHDQCIVEPELIKAKNGNAFKMFKAWYNDWCRLIYHEDEYLQISPIPKGNNKSPIGTPENNIKIFDHQQIGSSTAKNMKSLYSDDEDEVHSKCTSFIKQDLKKYESLRDYPSIAKSSILSPYINIGSISTRTIVSEVLKQFHGNKSSSTAFIREVAWRDFYRHKVVEFPHVVMNLPFNLKCVNLPWENDPHKFEAWCKGETGFPMVDASMRKLNHDGYMNNRCRMICATFLTKNLLIDWRYGEQYFMTKLIDGDFCSNNGGWGFVSSTGVNCQPFFRVFNPALQLKNFDKDLEFVNKWIPDYEGGYLDPIVDYKETKEMFIENYRANCL